MKRLITVIFLICLVMGLCVGFFKRASRLADKSSLKKRISNAQLSPDVIPMKINMEKSEVIPLETASPINPKVIYKSEDFSNATNDQATMEFYSKLRHWTDLGTVHVTEKNTQQLWLGDRMVFEAKVIQQVRTMSNDGTIVLAAVTKDVAPLATGEKLRDSELPSSIWAVDAQGHARRISAPNIIGGGPLISSDGKKVAFSAAPNGGNMLFQAIQIFVVDLKSGECRTFRSREHLDDYKVFPAEWAEGGKVLKVIEDWGENGGHMVIRRVRLE